MIAVLPSADTATAEPNLDCWPLGVPTSLLPCCAPGYGVAVTVKLPPAVVVPPDVVTDTPPVVAPGMTIATRLVPVFDMMMAETPPIETVGVPALRLVPEIVTSVPTGPVAGLKEVTVGAGVDT